MKNQNEVESWVDNYSSLNSELKLFFESGKKYMILTINKYAESFSMFVDNEPDLDDVYITSFINEDMLLQSFNEIFQIKVLLILEVLLSCLVNLILMITNKKPIGLFIVSYHILLIELFYHFCLLYHM